METKVRDDEEGVVVAVVVVDVDGRGETWTIEGSREAVWCATSLFLVTTSSSFVIRACGTESKANLISRRATFAMPRRRVMVQSRRSTASSVETS